MLVYLTLLQLFCFSSSSPGIIHSNMKAPEMWAVEDAQTRQGLDCRDETAIVKGFKVWKSQFECVIITGYTARKRSSKISNPPTADAAFL